MTIKQYLQEDINFSVFGKLRNAILAVMLGSGIFMNSLPAHASAVYEKDKDNLQSFFNRYLNEEDWVTAELNRIDKKLIEAKEKYHIPDNEILGLKAKIGGYDLKLHTSKFLQDEKMAKLFLKRYEEEVDKLIDKYKNDKDWTYKITDASWAKNLYNNTKKLYDKMEDKGISFIHIALLLANDENYSEDEKVRAFTLQEIIRIENKLYRADVPFIDIEALNIRTAKKIKNKLKNGAMAFEEIKQILKEYNAEADRLIKESSGETDTEKFKEQPKDNSIDSFFEDIAELDGKLYLSESEQEYLYESIKGQIDEIKDRVNKIQIRAKRAYDKNKITLDEYFKVKTFCNNVLEELEKITTTKYVRAYGADIDVDPRVLDWAMKRADKREMKRRLKNLLEKINKVLNDNAFVEILKKAGIKTAFFGVLTFFLLSVIPVPAAIITSIFGAKFLSNIVRKIMRRSREVEAGFVSSYEDFEKRYTEQQRKLETVKLYNI